MKGGEESDGDGLPCGEALSVQQSVLSVISQIPDTVKLTLCLL